MADMHFVYGMAHGNACEAQRIYEELYPRRRIPCAPTFQNLHQRLSETGTFNKSTILMGRPTTVRNVQLEEAVLNEIEENPDKSTRKIANMLNISNKLVWTILRDQQLYPFHIQRVQALLPRDFPQRVAYCNWVSEKRAVFPEFLSQILFTDEAKFSRNAITNYHNNHTWCEENPHVVRESHYQYEFSVNVWVGIIEDYLIGPHFLPPRLNGIRYREFLEFHLPELLEDVPIRIRQRMWFMHDGAPPHFRLVAREYLDQEYPARWIGSTGPRQWPLRSPDLNLLDFFLWGLQDTSSECGRFEESYTRIM